MTFFSSLDMPWWSFLEVECFYILRQQLRLVHQFKHTTIKIHLIPLQTLAGYCSGLSHGICPFPLSPKATVFLILTPGGQQVKFGCSNINLMHLITIFTQKDWYRSMNGSCYSCLNSFSNVNAKNAQSINNRVFGKSRNKDIFCHNWFLIINHLLFFDHNIPIITWGVVDADAKKIQVKKYNNQLRGERNNTNTEICSCK